MKSISIPSSVQSIGAFAFLNCISLTSIYSYLNYPVYLNSAFYGVNKTNCILYVPKGSKSIYKATGEWKDFLNIVEMTTAVPTIADEKIKIYPSLITEGFTINGMDGKAIMRLSDINGKVFFEKLVVNDEYISINSKPKGVYVIELTTNDGMITRKIIKQ